MPIENIIALCIGIPIIISLIVLLYIMGIKTANTEKEFKESKMKLNKLKIKYYEWILSEEKINVLDKEESEE